MDARNAAKYSYMSHRSVYISAVPIGMFCCRSMTYAVKIQILPHQFVFNTHHKNTKCKCNSDVCACKLHNAIGVHRSWGHCIRGGGRRVHQRRSQYRPDTRRQTDRRPSTTRRTIVDKVAGRFFWHISSCSSSFALRTITNDEEVNLTVFREFDAPDNMHDSAMRMHGLHTSSAFTPFAKLCFRCSSGAMADVYNAIIFDLYEVK